MSPIKTKITEPTVHRGMDMSPIKTNLKQPTTATTKQILNNRCLTQMQIYDKSTKLMVESSLNTTFGAKTCTKY